MENPTKFRILFLTAIALSLCKSTLAQDNDFGVRKASFGILAGCSSNKLVLPEKYDGDIQQADWSATDGSPTVGVYYDFPINVLNFSVYSNLLVRKTSYATSTSSQNVDTDVLINLTSLDLLVSVRQTFLAGMYQPFVYAGGLFSYNIEDSGKIYETTVESDQVVINLLSHRDLVFDYSIGLGFGAGVQRKLGEKYGISLQARYTTAGHTTQYLKSNQLLFLVGFSF